MYLSPSRPPLTEGMGNQVGVVVAGISGDLLPDPVRQGNDLILGIQFRGTGGDSLSCGHISQGLSYAQARPIANELEKTMPMGDLLRMVIRYHCERHS